MGKITEVGDNNFETEVLKLDRAGAWSISGRPGAARAKSIAPIVEEIAGEYEGKLKVAKLNVDDHPATAVAIQHPRHSEFDYLKRRRGQRTDHRRRAKGKVGRAPSKKRYSRFQGDQTKSNGRLQRAPVELGLVAGGRCFEAAASENSHMRTWRC